MTRVGESDTGPWGPFDIIYHDSGHIEVYWHGIFLAKGRPWVKDTSNPDYSALVIKIWEEKLNGELVK